jgi:hypothetical protein
MRIKTSTIIWLFIWCIFMGITVGSIGIGAAFPDANRITKPFVCPTGDLQLVTQDYHPSPIEVVTTLTWYCVDSGTGDRQEVNVFQMALIAGPVYGLLLFMVIFGWMLIRSSRRGPTSAPAGIQELFSSSPRLSAPMDDLEQRTSEMRERSSRLREVLLERTAQHSSADAPGSAATVEQRMAALKRLHDEGLITEQEYSQKRSQILGSL